MTMGFIRSAIVGRSSNWNDPAIYARVAVFVVLLSMAAGVALRLSGFVGGAYSWFIFSSASDDSWYPMGLAYDRIVGTTAGSLRDLFFVDGVKFQYPASSLLLYSAFDFLGIPTTPANLNVLVWLSVAATPFVVFAITVIYINQYQGSLRLDVHSKYAIAGAFAVSSLFFYPIMITWRLGQIQALLNLAFALSCLFWLLGRKFTAGVIMGISCLIKPQLSLFLIWAALRREKEFTVGQIAAVGIGGLLSLALYGWANNIYYLEVLSYISRRGEIFWDNTSVNGLVNGLFHPGETLIWKYHEFPPYNPVTYILTISTSAIIIGFALLYNRSSPSSSSLISFMTAGLSFTVASPVAWGHHYGIVMAMLAVSFVEILRQTQGTRRRNFLLGWGACFLLLSNYWNVSELAAGTPVALLQNWRLAAAFGLLLILYRLQAGYSENVEPAPRRGGSPRPAK